MDRIETGVYMNMFAIRIFIDHWVSGIVGDNGSVSVMEKDGGKGQRHLERERKCMSVNKKL